jgi:hypothetical protein
MEKASYAKAGATANTSGPLPQGGCLLQLTAQIGPAIRHRLTAFQSLPDHCHDRSEVFESSIVSLVKVRRYISEYRLMILHDVPAQIISGGRDELHRIDAATR